MRIQVFTLLIALVLGSCDRKNEDILVIPPETSPLSRQLIGYGVISVSYTHVVEEPEPLAPSLGYLRQGSIVKVIERRPVMGRIPGTRTETVESWVLVEGNSRGWLTESVLDIYDNESQAKTAAGSMLQ